MISHMMTLANGIIGVSVLAMPYCFKQCGIILATLLLLLCSLLSRLACHFLIKSAVMSRRRNYEFLAFHAFGNMGKFLVELFIIGFLLGTCVAFFVVMGDLGPEIIGKTINKHPEDIRTSLLITSAVFIILPLGLLRNIDSLSSICTTSIAFYICLVLKVISESTRHIFVEDWYRHVYYWKPAGILQCLPIFSMALFCQTQLFEIYDTLPNASLDKMNAVVKGALNICTSVYLCVGFFGYIAFCTQPFTGNILMSFEQSITSEIIKMGFVISVAFSFPLVIFPCRASLNSLLFRRVSTHEPLNNYIPETRFRCLTFTIVAISLVIGILIPNIEFVLGLVGSTIGVMICLIFPAAFFIRISTKSTNERLLAQLILLVGVWILTLGTYANLYAMEESSNIKVLTSTNKISNQINNLPLNIDNNIPMLNEFKEEKLPKQQEDHPNEDINRPDIRQEPPVPIERLPDIDKIEKSNVDAIGNVETLPPKIEIDDNKKAENNIKVQDGDAKALDQLFDDTLNLQKTDNDDKILINLEAIKKEEAELTAVNDFVKSEEIKEDKEVANKKQEVEVVNQKQEREVKIKQEEEENVNKKQKEIVNKKKQLLDEQNISVFNTNGNQTVSKISQDHILNALTKQVAQNNDKVKEPADETIDFHKKFMINDVQKEETNTEKEWFPIPIALKMSNQTKMRNSSIANENDDLLSARRDILQNHERDKRNIVTQSPDLLEKTDVKVKVTNAENKILDYGDDTHDRNTCLRSNESSLLLSKGVQEPKVETKKLKEIESLQTNNSPSEEKIRIENLIKASVHLSQQTFTEKAVPDISEVRIDTEYSKLKKRDLKAVTVD